MAETFFVNQFVDRLAVRVPQSVISLDSCFFPVPMRQPGVIQAHALAAMVADAALLFPLQLLPALVLRMAGVILEADLSAVLVAAHRGCRF
jgi:hypothetical protein